MNLNIDDAVGMNSSEGDLTDFLIFVAWLTVEEATETQQKVCSKQGSKRYYFLWRSQLCT